MTEFSELNIAQSIINASIKDILNRTEQIIKEKQLQTHYPQFMHLYFMNVLNEKINQFTPYYKTTKPGNLLEQKYSDIKKIQKDNLMPKQLQNQTNIKQLPDLLSQVGSKKLNLTNRSSFLKKKISQISSIPSKFSVKNQKTQKNKGSISKDNQKFKELFQKQQEDKDIKNLREKVDFRYKQIQTERKLHQERQRKHKQRLQNFQQQYQNNNAENNSNIKKGYTFSYDGDTIQAETKDQKLVYYSMKIALNKNIKNNKIRTAQKNNQSPKTTQQILFKSKTYRSKQVDKDQKDKINFTLDIPKLTPSPGDPRTSIFETDPTKLRIIDYKRLYGHKFNRYDKNSMTIDVTSKELKQNDNQEDYFAEKRHLRDSKNLNNKSVSSSRSKYSPKKLALPKLQGKYKLLDRYQEI